MIETATAREPSAADVAGPLVDVVVVSYNSRAHLRQCVEALAANPHVHVVVVDNASLDRSLEALGDLPATRVPLDRNLGFAAGCNVGASAGRAPFVLFLNPDATLDADSLFRLAEVLERDERVGAAAPRIVDSDGSLDLSLRRFPRLSSTYAQALFLHRLAPTRQWADETIRDPRRYERPAAVEWASGACLLVRRSALEEVGGLDERFFMYCEDQDLCRRLWDAGYDVRYEPRATCVHVGGASAPRPALLPTHAASRLRYSRKHDGAAKRALQRLGLALHALTHVVVSRPGLAGRLGHLRALAVIVRGATATRPSA